MLAATNYYRENSNVGNSSTIRHDNRTTKTSQFPSSRTLRLQTRDQFVSKRLTLREVSLTTTMGADGIGLFRTELAFNVMGHIPNRDEQQSLCGDVLRAATGPVVIRTRDIGSDKPLPPISVGNEPNPALGSREVRLYPLHEDRFRDQLAALLAAWQNHPSELSVMFPMIGTVDDWIYCRDTFMQVRDRAGITAHIRLGIMCEIPAVLYVLPDLAREGVEFVSLGVEDPRNMQL